MPVKTIFKHPLLNSFAAGWDFPQKSQVQVADVCSSYAAI